MRLCVGALALVVTASSAAPNPEIVRLAQQTSAYLQCASVAIHDLAKTQAFLAAGLKTGRRFFELSDQLPAGQPEGVYKVSADLYVLTIDKTLPVDFRLGMAYMMLTPKNESMEDMQVALKKMYDAKNCDLLLK